MVRPLVVRQTAGDTPGRAAEHTVHVPRTAASPDSVVVERMAVVVERMGVAVETDQRAVEL